MPPKPRGLRICLPISDRTNSMIFYRDTFGFELVGEPADDGVPEPLMFRVDQQTMLMLIPAGGFGWALGEGRELAPTGTSECIVDVGVADEDEVAVLVERIRSAGGKVLGEPQRKPWGYEATCTDPDGHVWQVSVEP
ncbi:VOC family protein [Rhodococcus sp. NPDC060090]|uniref:VOC family protein n=1 Tax=Rhodococcus sp. NPDC060090 TaxID=3347056 RepID=UPI003655BB7C